MDRKKEKDASALRRGYDIAILLLGGVLLGGVTACLLRPTAWVFLYAPVLAAVGAVLAWCALARLALCRQPERLLRASFTRPIKLAVCVPLWAGLAAALLCMPGTPAQEEEALAAALGVLLLLGAVTLVPLAAVAAGGAALVLGLRHMKTTPPDETTLYREGPFALAMILFFGVIVLCGIGAFTFFS